MVPIPHPHERPILAVGILTYRSPATLQRRHTLRSFYQPTPPGALVYFVMAHADVDVSLGDVLVFASPRNDRKMGTYLLTNRFFQYAVKLQAEFVARADDDAAFDTTAILRELRLVSASLRARHMVYGPFGEWYYWDRDAMLASCFDYSPLRWTLAAMQARQASATSQLPRWQAECLKPNGAGPFPYAKGPFVAYSLPVASALVERLAADETAALNRSTRPLLDKYGALTDPTRGRHPARTILYDDIYYSALVFELYAERELLLVEAPFSEFVKERSMRLQPGAIATNTHTRTHSPECHTDATTPCGHPERTNVCQP